MTPSPAMSLNVIHRYDTNIVAQYRAGQHDPAWRGCIHAHLQDGRGTLQEEYHLYLKVAEEARRVTGNIPEIDIIMCKGPN